MRFKHTIRWASAVGALAFGASGCLLGHGGHHLQHAAPCLLPLLCLATDPVLSVGVALVTIALTQHDHHRHHNRCGCPTRFWQDQQVWWYSGHWEFYDRGWYRVPDCPVPY